MIHPDDRERALSQVRNYRTMITRHKNLGLPVLDESFEACDNLESAILSKTS